LGGGDARSFAWALALSLLLHLGLGAAVVLYNSGPGRRIVLGPAYHVRLVGALPAPPGPGARGGRSRTKPSFRAQSKEALAPKALRGPKEAIGLKKKRASRTKKKIKRLSPPKPRRSLAAERQLARRLARIKAELAAKRRLESALKRIERRVASKSTSPSSGIGPGGAGAFATGGGAGELSVRFQVYYTQLWERVREQWILPEALLKGAAGLEAVVVVRIRRDGSVEKMWLERSSGNKRFDASALRAVERAAPFPPLPSGYRGRVMEVGIRFRPQEGRS